MKLVNVRLNEADARKVAQLRRRGVTLSSIVRDAIRSSSENGGRPRTPEDADKFFAEMDEKFPLPELPPRGWDVHDRHQFRAAMVTHLRAKRERQ